MSIPTDHLTHLLHQHGYRATPQRLAILTALAQAECHLTPGEIYQRTTTQLPGIAEPTIYRALEALAQAGIILSAPLSNGKIAYELAEPHHHLHCTACQHSLQLPHHAFAPLYQHLQQQTGFLLNYSHLTLLGICPECQQTHPKLEVTLDEPPDSPTAP
ncbi:MAG: transcriptional repressor [Anaerolineales bacterium]